MHLEASRLSEVVSALGSQPSDPGSISGCTDSSTESVTITLSRHFCASLHVGHARRIRPVLKYRITDLEA